MSAVSYPNNPAFIGLFARIHTIPFTFVHAVSLVNHWSAAGTRDKAVAGLRTSK